MIIVDRSSGPDPVHGTREDQHIGIGVGQQVHAPLGDHLQFEEVPEIRT